MDGGDRIMITISDIARETGLSTATVSNALSGKGRVSDARRKQILEVATRMGYDFSRIRVAQPHRGIAVIVETLSVIFCTKIAEGICRAAEEGGYQVKRVRCVDMFPGTVHVECVVLMSHADR